MKIGLHLTFFILFLTSQFVFSQADSLNIQIDTSDYFPGDLNYNILIAAEKGNAEEVLRMLNEGADVNSKTFEEVTALMYAVQNEDIKTAKVLLLNGADPNLLPYNGIPALITAVTSGNMEITELILRNNGHVNISDYDGITPLMTATANNDIEMVDMLLYYEADVNQADSLNNTALIVSSYYGYSDISELLIENKASVNHSDNIGFTPLHCAAQNNNTDIAGILLMNNADIEQKSENGFSSLATAVANNNYQSTKYLLDKGADPNSRINAAVKPLNLAIDNKNDSIITLLKANQAKKSNSLLLDYFTIDLDFSFSANDFMGGGGLGIYDSKYDASFSLGFQTRWFAKRILVEEPDPAYDYTQYWERRSFFYANLRKRFVFAQNNFMKFGGMLGAKEIWTYGKYRGAENKPESKFLFVPQAGFYYQISFFAATVEYEYMNFDIHKVSAGRITLGARFYIRNKKRFYTPKKELWYF